MLVLVRVLVLVLGPWLVGHSTVSYKPMVVELHTDVVEVEQGEHTDTIVVVEYVAWKTVVEYEAAENGNFPLMVAVADDSVVGADVDVVDGGGDFDKNHILKLHHCHSVVHVFHYRGDYDYD